ncbi:DNA polymerase III subunit beta [Halomicronema hongdechloris C2206]|uniref:Beta sliding clamp n=1 Tax=Halomicronema hongdechloris C2206 TaxID=1641165 RepID=A0A1V8NHB8_9CYAN|nr:DNA polymerase III subunit beta [Halomicronema hongdechloris]ASC73901.1 DNA polymerase III subunit beta [Halomicronema hongdechloris C2206]
MKFTCSQSELNSQLSLVSRAIPSRPSRPILGNILITADSESQQLTLVGFDETLGVETTFTAQVETDGRLTLPARLLGDIVSRLPAEDIQLQVNEDETTVTLVSTSGEYQVRGLSADDYPQLPTVADGQSTQVSAETLLAGLQGSLFSTSADETKQVLTGVHVVADETGLEFAATDGHRLAVVNIEDTVGETKHGDDSVALKVTLPAKALRELERIVQLYATSEPVTVRFDHTQAMFELGQQRLTTRLLEGQYPNYRQLIPKQFARQVTVDRRLLLSALERIAVLADQKNHIIKLTMASGAQTVAMSVEAQEVGSGREVLAAQVSGEDMDIAFNVRYLLDGLKALTTSEVQMQCNSPTSPSILTPLGELKMTYLVMPVQIRS